MDLFIDPSPAEKVATDGLIGRRVNIWWDGDNVFYPGKIVGYQSTDGAHQVKYDNDDEGPVCAEQLSKQPWKLWSGTEADFDAYNQAQLQVGLEVAKKQNIDC
jgi:hypothetical protein